MDSGAPPRQARDFAGPLGKNILAPALIFLGVIVVWEGVTRLRDIKAYLLPSPSLIAGRILADWPILFSNLKVTLRVEMA